MWELEADSGPFLVENLIVQFEGSFFLHLNFLNGGGKRLIAYLTVFLEGLRAHDVFIKEVIVNTLNLVLDIVEIRLIEHLSWSIERVI